MDQKNNNEYIDSFPIVNASLVFCYTPMVIPMQNGTMERDITLKFYKLIILHSAKALHSTNNVGASSTRGTNRH